MGYVYGLGDVQRSGVGNISVTEGVRKGVGQWRCYAGKTAIGYCKKILRFFKKSFDFAGEHRKARFEHAPDNFIGNRCVPVNKPVAERYDTR